MRKKLAIAVAGIALFALAAPVWAHHAFAAEFDEKRPIKLAGVVTKWELVNPHSWIHMDVKNSDGTVTSWTVEGAGRRGRSGPTASDRAAAPVAAGSG